MSKKKSKIKSDDVAITGDYDDNVRDQGTGFDMSKLDKAIKESCPYKYFVLSHDCILGLQLSVCEAMKEGFKPTGGVSAYLDKALGRRVWIQAVVKDDN